MALTPDDVHNKEFHTAFRGYNEEEVDAFLDEVEAELRRLITSAERVRQQPEVVQPAESATTGTEGDALVRRTLLIAQRTADSTIAEAQATAQRIVDDARAQATRLTSAAHERAHTELAELERRRVDTEHQLNRLRAFERDYRGRLTSFLEAQLRELQAARPPEAGEAAAPKAAQPQAATVTEPREVTRASGGHRASAEESGWRPSSPARPPGSDVTSADDVSDEATFAAYDAPGDTPAGTEAIPRLAP